MQNKIKCLVNIWLDQLYLFFSKIRQFFVVLLVESLSHFPQRQVIVCPLELPLKPHFQ